METLVIGDLHGRFDVAEEAIAGALRGVDYQKAVFVGDYLDSYTEGSERQIRTLLSVMGGSQSYPDKVEGLLGNHEISYVTEESICSGYDHTTQIMVNAIGCDNIKKVLKSYTYVGQYLVTHAGVSQSLLRAQKMTLEEYLTSGEHNQIGRARGGYDPVGGLRWCDFNKEFLPIPDVRQIFGHTHYTFYDDFKVSGENYNIDCIPFSAVSYSEPDAIAYGLLVDEETGGVSRYAIL